MSAQTFDAQHEDMLHDAQLDYYSKRLATCSSDRVIKIFNIGPDQSQTHTADLTGHEGPVWQVAWAHPRFGSLLASCGYDRRVMIWKEGPSNVWTRVYEYAGHDGSVNAVAWAPQEQGLSLACASSDGCVSVLSHNDDDSWTARVIRGAHQVGCNSVSWAPAAEARNIASNIASNNNNNNGNNSTNGNGNNNGGNGNNGGSNNARARLVTGGCDNLVSVWCEDPGEPGAWRLEESLSEHRDWVRAVAWAPNVGVPASTVASGSQDGEVIVWSRSEAQGGSWGMKKLPAFGSVVYGLSWSPMGNILAVASGDNKVSLWKESLDGEWNKISTVSENGQMG